MGYCGIKIPGHSETEFKHRTAFRRRKKVVDIENTCERAITSSRNYTYDYKKANRLRIVSLIVICTLSITLYFGSKNMFKIGLDPHLSALQSPKKNTNPEKVNAAYVMYNSAKSYYNSGAWNLAQDEIIRVLKLYPTNKDALILMSEILSKQCEVNNKYCKEASDYDKYLALNI